MKKITLISLGVIILLLGGVVLYKFYPSQEPQKAYAEITFPDDPKITGGTQTYFSEKFNLKITFPEDWYLTANEDDKPGISYGGPIQIESFLLTEQTRDQSIVDKYFKFEILSSPLNLRKSVLGFNKEIKNLDEWLEIHKKISEEYEPSDELGAIISSDRIKINGKEIIIEKYNGIITAYVIIGQDVLAMSGYNTNGVYSNFFFEIINSLKFSQ